VKDAKASPNQRDSGHINFVGTYVKALSARRLGFMFCTKNLKGARSPYIKLY